ncbi:cytochrome P450 81Q32-like isoform X2 [Zingiber officinale]|uniref:cytochrome P450 81Q32-like isoform X2 n=1 Tax=Zingiber officinale TaxID=94328 RepID=UPI001C4B6D5A|nr:cytochrome P450 81Q32-like isoform X2 [Zingiber officinale]
MALLQFLLPSLFLFLFSILLIYRRQRQNHRRLPPSPPSFPILGHLHLLKPPIHRPLAAISAAHGPVVLLRFGSRPVLLVSSPSAAEECFTVHDVAFANRPRFLAGKILGYDFTAILWAPYGSHWRDLRRVTSVHLLAPGTLRASADLRSGEIRALARNLFLQQGAGSGGAPRRLDLKSTLFDLVCAIIEQLVVPLTGETPEQRLIVREMVTEGIRLSAAAANAGDYMPAFMRVAWRGLEKRLMRLRRRRDEFWGKLIVLHRERRQIQDNGGGGVDGEGRKTMMDVMLSLHNIDPERYTDDIIKGLMMAEAVFVSPSKKSRQQTEPEPNASELLLISAWRRRSLCCSRRSATIDRRRCCCLRAPSPTPAPSIAPGFAGAHRMASRADTENLELATPVQLKGTRTSIKVLSETEKKENIH